MATPPPVPAAKRYPLALRDFLTYQNQPGDTNRFLSTPDPNNPGYNVTTDLTLDGGAVTRDIQTEIVSMENTIGIKPFKANQSTLGKAIYWLLHNLSPGHADAGNRNNLVPLPPTHTHVHRQTVFIHSYTDPRGHLVPAYTDTTDDHPQYVRVDGSRGFTAPVRGQPAQHAHDLITLSQAQGAGLTGAQVQGIIQSELNATSDHPMTGPGAGRYKLAGGYFYGASDVNGVIFIDFSECHFSRLVTFVYMKNIFPGGSMLGWPTFQYQEDQLILLAMDTRGAWVQFIEDIVVDRQAAVAMTWMALGA
jgi:hypothetical protein